MTGTLPRQESTDVTNLHPSNTCYPPLGMDQAAHICCPKSQGTLSHCFSDDLIDGELRGGAGSATRSVAARESGKAFSHMPTGEGESFY